MIPETDSQGVEDGVCVDANRQTGPVSVALDAPRRHLLLRGWLHTLRDPGRTVGETWARWERLGPARADVEIERVGIVERPDDLREYVDGSGYGSVREWCEAARGAHGVETVDGLGLFRVELLGFR